MCTGTRKTDASRGSPSLGNTLGNYSGKSNKGLGGVELNQSGIPSRLPLVHLHPASVVELGGTSKTPASVRDRLSLTREGKLWCKVCPHPHLEQGGMPLVERWLLWCEVCPHPHLEQGGMPPVERWLWSLFSLLQMGANNSSLTPLNCILKNWDRFDPS